MGELFIIFVICLCLLAGLVGLLFYRKGVCVESNRNFMLIQIFPLILSLLYISSLPSNFVAYKILGYALAGLILITPLIKQKNFMIARVMTAVISCLLIYMVFFS